VPSDGASPHLASDDHGHTVRSTTPDLIRMANQIAANYAHHPADQASRELASHLRSFWTPAMRADLAEWFEQSDASANRLHPLVVSAVRSLQSPAATSG
jgi:formate dehydrogenase subunit delta